MEDDAQNRENYNLPHESIAFKSQNHENFNDGIFPNRAFRVHGRRNSHRGIYF
jgi:hypothetical protein